MPSSSGGYFHQFCHVTKACVSVNWHQRRLTCRVLRREVWRSVYCRHRRRMFAWRAAALLYLTTEEQVTTHNVGFRELFIFDRWHRPMQINSIVRSPEVERSKILTLPKIPLQTPIHRPRTGLYCMFCACVCLIRHPATVAKSSFNVFNIAELTTPLF